MALWRCNIQLAIPKATYDAIPIAKKLVIRDAIREFKALAVNINEGQPNEEMTTIANWQICYHNEGVNHPPCGPWQEI